MIGSFVITAVQKWIAGDKQDKVAHLTFRDLLTAVAAAVEANDGEGLASLFTEDGTYEDGFFGAHTGRPAIAMMLQRFHDTGRAYLWEFLDPLSDGSIGYARFRFSYASLLPEAAGRPVLFEGISCFRFRDGLITRYGEAFSPSFSSTFRPSASNTFLPGLQLRKTVTRKPNVTFIAFPLGERQRVLEWVRCSDREHSNQCQKAKSRKGCSCST